MPCNSEYMNQTSDENFRQQTAKNLVYVLKFLCEKVPTVVTETSKAYYAEVDFTPKLCATIKDMKKSGSWKEFTLVAIDSKKGRAVLDWADDHVKADRIRKSKDEKAKRLSKIKANALKKLTKEEKKVLGL